MKADDILRRQQREAMSVLIRWKRAGLTTEEYDTHLLGLQKQYRKFVPNVFILNKKALLIQHAYFGVKAGIRKVVKALKREGSAAKILFRPKYGLNESGVIHAQIRHQRPPISGSKFGSFKESVDKLNSPRGTPMNYTSLSNSNTASKPELSSKGER